ncbi:metallophosphoesterase [Luteococcus sp. Sow4_B9]|uniref:metallophosphoesterase n=1 Tax=Luteococcus sp. Sow4_B9 TaxID=3438792 RepID=UPI003F9B1C2C
MWRTGSAHRRTGAGVSALALAASIAVWGGTTAANAVSPCDGLGSELYQQINNTSGTSLVTAWKSEFELASQYNFSQVGAIGKVSQRPAEGLVPVHRLTLKGDFVTAPAPDLQSWLDRGYVDNGIYFHAAPASASCGVAVHRVVRKGIHREVLAQDVAALVGQGWIDVGVKYRAASVDAPVSGQLPGSPAPAPAPTQEAEPTRAPEPVTAPAPAPAPAPALGDADADGRFGFAVIPDVQDETTNAGAPRTVARNKWLVQRKGAADLDLRAVLQVGDLVNWDTPTHDQYVNASGAMKVLEDNGLPWVGAIGNHDGQATGEGGSARPGVDTRVALRDTTVYNRYFDASRFRLRTASADNTQDTSVHTFEAGGLKWMVVSLEVWPRQEKLDWAKQQVAAHPDHNVILLTHSYLDWNGSVASGNDGYGALPATAIRDQLVSQYPNVKMVFSGHLGLGQTMVQDFGTHRVVAMLQNYDNFHDTMTRLVQVDAKANTITHSYRSATTDRVVTGDTTIDQMAWVR